MNNIKDLDVIEHSSLRAPPEGPAEPTEAPSPVALVASRGPLPAGDLVPDVQEHVLSPSAKDIDPVAAYLAGFASPQSRRTVGASLRRCAAVARLPVERVAWHQLQYAHTNAIRARLLEKYSPKTFQITMDALRGVLKTCRKLGYITAEQFFQATEWPTERSSRLPAGRELAQEELDALNERVNGLPGPYGAFLRALFAVLMGTGLRATEVSKTLVKDYEPVQKRIHVIGKGNVEAYVPVGPDEIAALDDWLAVRRVLEPKAPWLFVRVGPDGAVYDHAISESALHKICRKASEDAEIGDFSPHDCRRTFCTRMLRAGMAIQQVQRLMRHASIVTTQRYDRAQDEEIAKVRQGHLDRGKRRREQAPLCEKPPRRPCRQPHRRHAPRRRLREHVRHGVQGPARRIRFLSRCTTSRPSANSCACSLLPSGRACTQSNTWPDTQGRARDAPPRSSWVHRPDGQDVPTADELRPRSAPRQGPQPEEVQSTRRD